MDPVITEVTQIDNMVLQALTLMFKHVITTRQLHSILSSLVTQFLRCINSINLYGICTECKYFIWIKLCLFSFFLSEFEKRETQWSVTVTQQTCNTHWNKNKYKSNNSYLETKKAMTTQTPLFIKTFWLQHLYIHSYSFPVCYNHWYTIKKF